MLLKKDVTYSRFYIIIPLILFLLFQYLIIKTDSALIIQVGIVAILAVVIVAMIKKIEFHLFLLVATLLPFVVINSTLHYSLSYKIMLDILLFLFVFLSIFLFFYKEKSFEFNVSYLKFPIIAISIYAVFATYKGVSSGNSMYWVFDEFYNHLYFFLVIPITYTLRKFKNYKLIFITLVSISFFLALEYIYLNITSSRRVTSFQADIFSLTLGICISYFLLAKEDNFIKRMGALFVGIIIIIGTYFTQTRSLWLAAFIALVSIVLYYKLVYKNSNGLPRKWFYLGLIFAVFILLYGVLNVAGKASSQQKQTVNRTTSERVESISAPTSDASFLMRVEIGYYIVQRFLKNPIFGEGFGGNIKYKIFGDRTIHYSDNSWLYFLWKEGIIGFALFVLLFWRFFRQLIFVLQNTENLYSKIFLLGIFGGFLGILFVSLLTANLIKYGKLNFIYAIVFAYVEFEKVNLTKNKIEE